MLNLFSTRELSILIWITVGIVFQLFNPEKRQDLKDIFKLLFGKNLIIGNSILIGYITGVLLGLKKIGIWDTYLLKDTFFWFVTVAYVLFLSMTKAKTLNYFKDIFIECLKWTIITEFIINFYTFSFVAEFILVPLVFCLTFTIGIVKQDESTKRAVKLIKGILTCISITAFFYAAKHILPDIKSYLTFETFCSFILAPVLTISLIPILYCFSMFVHYQEIFTDVTFMSRDKYKIYQIKKQILIIANVNINRISAIRDKINKQDLFTAPDLKIYIKELVTLPIVP